ncbi:heme peroxidase family protein [Rhodobacter sp. Har01]|uniref:peroxidase family protein n=1 Tax=Rhodobacter sp. Har01 TaxID=2883999 RepID=UPI001D071AA9|nr:heme peroxidase family protein [Rhodobacter sp. Har01]MCB6179203.1 heme peroxidase family protein [Rhodobacter sp. Har01]
MKAISAHGHATREMTRASLQALSATGDPGKFGRMFPLLDPLVVSDAKLAALAAAMQDAVDPVTGLPLAAGDNPNVPAGYTYLGQFIDHDITLDTTPLEAQEVDPLATTNFRSPTADLDSLYGQGPAIDPHLYQRDPVTHGTTARLLIGRAGLSPDFTGGPDIPAMPNDLPRNQVGRALIGDERNDENLLVAQTHLLFLKFHNKVVDQLAVSQPGLTGDALFDEARRIVTWHYQWIVLFDFVERLTEPGLVRQIKNHGRRFYRFRSRPYMPAEFAAAAYRLGHSMVRETYSHNRVFRDGGAVAASLGLLFNFTGKSGNIVGELVDQGAVATPGGPGPLRDLPSNWVIDWRRFFDLGTAPGTPGFELNLTRRLDPFIVPALHTLPGMAGPAASLAFRNLRRGVILGLPSGQDVARAMGVVPLTAAEVGQGPDGAVAAAQHLDKETPLWYYILKEAQVKHQGMRLGPVGSTLIAETFLGLIHGDRKSFLWLRSNWVPELPGQTPGHFTMADLIRFVDDINPIG